MVPCDLAWEDHLIRMTRVTGNRPIPWGCHDILITVAAFVLLGNSSAVP